MDLLSQKVCETAYFGPFPGSKVFADKTTEHGLSAGAEINITYAWEVGSQKLTIGIETSESIDHRMMDKKSMYLYEGRCSAPNTAGYLQGGFDWDSHYLDWSQYNGWGLGDSKTPFISTGYTQSECAERCDSDP